MIRLDPTQLATVADAIALAREVPGIAQRVRAIYTDVQTVIGVRRPRCDVSGRCCRFEEYGHLLFVTTIELAAFRDESVAAKHPLPSAPHDVTGCPYQLNGLCSVHTFRPFGCRIYFCDPSAQEWQQSHYEAFHLRLRAMHEELNVPYFYVEWRQGLRALDATIATR